MKLARELATLRARVERLAAPVQVTSDPLALAAQAGITLDPWQRDVLLAGARQIILLVHRQGGKSTVSSIRALYKALNCPRALILLLAPSYRQSKELFLKVKKLFEKS